MARRGPNEKKHAQVSGRQGYDHHAWRFGNRLSEARRLTEEGKSVVVAALNRGRSDSTGAECATTNSWLPPAHLQPDEIASLAPLLVPDQSHTINDAMIPADAGWCKA
ncbi:MAG TPA: hypothetical protein VD789_02545 [Thermomicrobiales bacterium]|nr:hypothetical protein [Thermomicrobiales bacterium]